MNFFCKSVTLCLLIVLSANRSNAQNESLHFDHIGFDDGISNENVTVIFQDSKGWLWFGTMGGLNKYDGYSFTTYQFDPFDSTSLSQNIPTYIWEDQSGFIWIATSEGLCRFDRATEKFIRYKPDPNAPFSDPNISAIDEDNTGMMWVGNHSGGLCRFDRQTGMFLPDTFQFNGSIHIYKDRSGTLWLGSFTGLYKVNLHAKKAGKSSVVSFSAYQHNPANPKSISSNSVSDIFGDSRGVMWVSTENGLNSFDRTTGTFRHYLSYNLNWLGSSIKEDQQGNLWIATNNGLHRLDSDRTRITSYFHNPDDPYSLSTNNIVSLNIDKANVLYLGSLEGKLNKANLNPKFFGLKRHEKNNSNSLSSNTVTSIVEDTSGIVWIGTHGGGLNRWDRKKNHFTHYRHNPNNTKTLRSDSILALMEDRHGHLWICNGDVLSQLNKKTGNFTHYNTIVKRRSDNHWSFIYSIVEDREGFIWLGTGNGLKRFNEITGEFKHYEHNPTDTTGISDYTATTVFVDSRDNIWVGYGSRATDRFNKRTNRFVHYRHDTKDSTGISSNVVSSFHEDSKGNLWLGTLAGGLCYFDYKTEKFRTFTDHHGLPGNTVYSVLSDGKNHLWLGTDKGLSRFDPVTNTFTNYDYKDGLQGNKFAAGGGGDMDKGACFKGRDGTLYFGGANGFNYFDPMQLKAHSYVAPIVITQFKLFDMLVKGANELKEIVLKYNQNYFSFEFSSLSYYNPSKNQYAYKLEGVDKDWIYSGSRRYVSYTNIDPGTYTFRVKGTNNDGVWNEKGTSISIKIHPPWWKTWLFKIAATLFLVASFYGLIRWRMQQKFKRRLQQSEKEKQVAELQQQKTELEMQALRAQMNPHFIFNSLNSINRFILQNNRQEASEYLTKFSRLTRLILQNSQSALISLESELEALRLYLELEALRFDHHFDYEINVDNDLDISVIKVPPLIIQPYAENAIWHGLMHKQEKGHLAITIFEQEGLLCFKITDDGVGRKKAVELKSKSASLHKSMGMRITVDRLAMLKSNPPNKAPVVITDLVLPDGSPGGTEVLLRIPATL